MDSRFTRLAGTAILTGFTLASFGAVAPSAASADEQDPGVARISLLSGDVDVKRADSGDNVAAVVNAPLNAGDYLTTQDDARAELQLDGLTELRVAPDTQLRFTTMTPDSNALQLAQGTVEMRLFRGNGANPEIDAPNATIRPNGNGAFRITVDNDGNAIVTVRSGEATVSTQNDSQTIGSGSSVAVQGNAGGARFESIGYVASDDFDAFNSDRDRHEADAPSYAYVNDEFVGAGDLDQYGTWQNVDGYGEVWHPHYAADWAPYQDGSWSWEPYYGWTWISAEPWGWAPYHYGRWFYAANDGGWCWTPATRYFPPVYRPAQVAFFSFGFGGGGGGLGIGIGIGNIGWVALGPTDPFRPWWGGNGYGYGGRGYGSTTIVNNFTNVTNVTNIYNYHNINAPGGIVAVNKTDFRNGEFRQRLNVTPAQLRTANIGTVRGVVPVVPTTRNLAFNGAQPEAKRYPLSRTFDRFKPVAARSTVPTFAEQRAAVSTVAARAYPTEAKSFEREAPTRSPDTREPLARSAPAERAASGGVPVIDGETTGTPRVPAAERQPALEATKSTSPWDRFAKPNSPNDLAKPSAARQSAIPKVTDVRAADGAPARGASLDPERPSYARPETTESGAAAAPRAPAPRVETIDGGHSAGSAWDRFGGTARASQNAPASSRGASSRNDDALPVTHGAERPVYSTPANGTPIRSNASGTAASAASEPVGRRYSTPASAPRNEGVPAYSARGYSQPVERATRDRTATTHSAAHAAPAERSAPAERAAPSDKRGSSDRADAHHERE